MIDSKNINTSNIKKVVRRWFIVKKQNFKLYGLVLMLFLLVGITSATCTTTTVANGTDFMGINQTTYSEIPMGDAQKWSDFTYFTPRLNFSHVVYESIVGQMTSTNYTIGWKMIPAANTFTSVNSTFVLKNGTNTISVTNYTLSSTDNVTYKITFLDSRYNGTTLTAQFNRTFVKNVDDIFLNATGISGLGSFSTFIQANTPSDYGDSKLFRPSPVTVYGDSINLTDWAVGWQLDYTDCGSGCKTINTTLLDVILTMFIIGMLVFIGYAAYSGNLSTKSIVIMVVTFVIMLVFMIILKNILGGVCTI